MTRNARLVNRKFIQFFIPSVLMAASASLSLIIDSIIVGNVLSENELAAMNLIMPMTLIFTAISGMFGIGAATCVSVFKGKMDGKSANKTLTLSVFAWIFFSIASILTGIFANSVVAKFLSGSSGLNDLVECYLKVYLLGAPFTFATLIFPHIIKADGKPKLSSNALIIANALNLCLDVVFMKFMKMGLAGGALATILGNLIGALIYIIYIKSKGRTLRLCKVEKKDIALYLKMFKMGIASIFGQGFMFGKMWIFNMIISDTAGKAGLAAFSVCNMCLSFVSMFIAGAAQTMMPMIGAWSGSEDYTAIKFTVYRALKIIMLSCAAVTSLFEIFPGAVLCIYGINAPEVFAIGIRAVRLFSIALSGIGFSFMYMYYVQSSGKAAFSMQICALEGFVIIVPVCLIMSKLIGADGIWISYAINELLVAGFIAIKARITVKKSNGALYSIFMLRKRPAGITEFSVDLSNDVEIEASVAEIGKNFKEDQVLLFRNMLELSKSAYAAEKGLKTGDTADVIINKHAVSVKDMGSDYTRIDSENQIEKLKELNRSYRHTLMIGMNYSVAEFKEEII